jgi:hypothetical protein
VAGGVTHVNIKEMDSRDLDILVYSNSDMAWHRPTRDETYLIRHRPATPSPTVTPSL